MKKIIISAIIFLFSTITFANIKVVTTTTVIYDLVKEIGKEKVKVDYLCRGDQDPHFLEILPSYMLKLRNADVVFKIGLGLELWLQQLIDGSRNDKLKLIDLSTDIEKKEVPTGKIDASQGDIHPYGNPHYWLDPENAKKMAKQITEVLSDLSPDNSAYFQKNFTDFITKLDSKINEWKTKLNPVKGKPILTFHKSWVYFADRFGLKIAGQVEPKPGIPPTPSHNAELISEIKRSNIKLILMENYYSDNAPNQLSKATGVKVVKVANAVYGQSGISSYIQMIDSIVNSLSNNL
ncbi:MAG: zinc ABC transporter substrate-binding protein [Ignavibacteriaceae bacterium]|nr:zinc ABC transporter substrate-binding protein [Ignavibacteriaceae bacterium]